jgi:hypothetical protein
MNWYQKMPLALVSVFLSLGVGALLYGSGISSPGVALLSAIALEIVIVVHRTFLQVSQADPIRGLAQAPEIDHALTSAREVLQSSNRPARILTRQTLSTFIDRVTQMGSTGIPVSPQEFMSFAEELLGSTRRGDWLRATSVLAGGSYWSRAYGAQYEAVNRQASERGLSIERLYLLKDEAHLAKITGILERQVDFSKVRVALLDAIEIENDNVDLRRDFFVFNELVSAEFVFVDPNAQLKHILVCTNVNEVRRLAREYERIRVLTKPWDP